jgi:hypothetical protein
VGDAQFEIPEVLVPVSERFRSQSIGEAIFELSSEDRAISRYVNSMAVAASKFIVAYVIVAISEDIITPAVSNAIQELADVFFTVCIRHDALAVLLAVMGLTDIFVSASRQKLDRVRDGLNEGKIYFFRKIHRRVSSRIFQMLKDINLNCRDLLLHRINRVNGSCNSTGIVTRGALVMQAEFGHPRRAGSLYCLRQS